MTSKEYYDNLKREHEQIKTDEDDLKREQINTEEDD